MQKQFFQFDQLYTGKDELLVVKNSLLFEHGQWQGFLIGDWGRYFEEVVMKHMEWLPREQAEDNPDYQQIIPWGVFRLHNLYLELKRGAEGSHTRLYNRYTIGVGGHCFKREFEKLSTLPVWMEHKFHDELHYKGNVQIRPIGVVNDNADNLGRHHFGLVYLMEGDSDEISLKKHIEHRLLPLKGLTGEDIQFLDRWSQMVYRQLRDFENDGVAF